MSSRIKELEQELKNLDEKRKELEECKKKYEDKLATLRSSIKDLIDDAVAYQIFGLWTS